MKPFITKAQNISRRAAELKAAIQALPPKVAEFRETVAQTAGQLHQLRAEVQSSVAELKADNDDHLSQALQEINTSQDVFLEAGFELSGVELELSPVQRLLVRLNKLEDVALSTVRALIARHQKRKTTHAILTALQQAQQMADEVELIGLEYRELLVSVGPIPSVRICWRGEELASSEAPKETAQAAAVPPSLPPSAFTQSTYFERKPAETPVQTSAIAVKGLASAPAPLPSLGASLPTSASPGLTPASPSAVTATENDEAKHDPLARFKRMPNLTRPGR